MRAARLNHIGDPLVIEQLPIPSVHPDGVIVRVMSSHMMSYTDEVFSGKAARISPPIPYTPGLSAIGVIEDVGVDVVGFSQGDFVFCHPHVVDSHPGREPEQILIGWFGLTPGAQPLLEKWKNGSFAEYAGYPAKCVTQISSSLMDQHEALASLNVLTVAYGALLKGAFAPGMSVVINGATGNIGACTALLALSLGARKVIGLGRDQDVLEQLRALDSRMHGVQLSGDTQADLAHVQALDSRIDMCVDASAAHDSASTEVALNSLRSGGVAVWVGGVRAEIPVSYFKVLIKELTIRGSYMYGPECPADLIRMIETGFLQLERIRTHAFALEDVNEAIRFAPSAKGLSAVVIQP